MQRKFLARVEAPNGAQDQNSMDLNCYLGHNALAFSSSTVYFFHVNSGQVFCRSRKAASFDFSELNPEKKNKTYKLRTKQVWRVSGDPVIARISERVV